MIARHIQCVDYNRLWDIGELLEPLHNQGEEPETYQYFYHPDHLGSSSFITDINGYAEQHVQYLPFGELFVNQQNTSFDSRYKFTAKEHDQESNYTYFGARYYDSDLSVWLSVDPLADKYPSMSAFMYCAGNPVNAIDPDGRKVYFLFYNSSDKRFQAAAQTRYNQITSHKNYDSKSDYVYMIPLTDLGLLGDIVATSTKDAQSKGYGLTFEASFFTHGGVDGPSGDLETSGTFNLKDITGNPADKLQLSPEGWSQINWNFDPKKSVAAFYGCQTASFAEIFFNYSNVAYTAGQDFKVGPTYSLNKWNSVYFPGKKDNVYYRGFEEGAIFPMAVYSRNKWVINSIGERYRPATYPGVGNITPLD